MLVVDGSVGAFELLCAVVAVESYDEDVAVFFGVVYGLDVAGVEEVEDAVGHCDCFVLFAVFLYVG